MITAELSTAFPENGGYVVWVSAAFGPFWGFQEGWWKWLSGVIDNSLYPVLFLDYLKRVQPAFGSGPTRYITLIVITAVLTYLNYRGLTIVGGTAMALTVFSLLPFATMAVFAIPKLKPSNWFLWDKDKVDWRGYFNTLFWNLNYWDSVSSWEFFASNSVLQCFADGEPTIEVWQHTCGGGRLSTFPRALLAAVFLVVGTYLVPLLAGTGALYPDRAAWNDGYFADVGALIGGSWLKWWIMAAAAFSNMGLFEAEMSSDSFQLLGMAERGLLPDVFARRSKYGTPVLAIVCSASGVIALCWMDFQEIVELLNFLYCFGMLLEFAAFIWLRVSQPHLDRPFKIPVGAAGAIVLCLAPSLTLVLVMCLASKNTIIVSFLVSLLGFLLYPLLMLAKQKGWLQFHVEPGLPDLQEDALPMTSGPLAAPQYAAIDDDAADKDAELYNASTILLSETQGAEQKGTSESSQMEDNTQDAAPLLLSK
eukprot:SM000441S16121  [mRNA]  locus=s441:24154:27283:+ [translate_table: standard]